MCCWTNLNTYLKGRFGEIWRYVGDVAGGSSLPEGDALRFWFRSIAKFDWTLALRYYETNGSACPSRRLEPSGTYFAMNCSCNLHFEFRNLNSLHHVLLFVWRTQSEWHWLFLVQLGFMKIEGPKFWKIFDALETN